MRHHWQVSNWTHIHWVKTSLISNFCNCVTSINTQWVTLYAMHLTFDCLFLKMCVCLFKIWRLLDLTSLIKIVLWCVCGYSWLVLVFRFYREPMTRTCPCTASRKTIRRSWPLWWCYSCPVSQWTTRRTDRGRPQTSVSLAVRVPVKSSSACTCKVQQCMYL